MKPEYTYALKQLTVAAAASSEDIRKDALWRAGSDLNLLPEDKAAQTGQRDLTPEEEKELANQIRLTLSQS
jgi:hypothetical protein